MFVLACVRQTGLEIEEDCRGRAEGVGGVLAGGPGATSARASLPVLWFPSLCTDSVDTTAGGRDLLLLSPTVCSTDYSESCFPLVVNRGIFQPRPQMSAVLFFVFFFFSCCAFNLQPGSVCVVRYLHEGRKGGG